ncbi:MAG: caspase family protein, partial [Ignavibacteriae bacterium]|nr:caspase family protein [Ignavibacteriota bacterium]
MVIQYGHFNDITSIAESNNGKYIITSDKNGVLILWDVVTGYAIRSLSMISGVIREISFTNYDENAIFENNDIIYLWDIKTGDIIRDFRGQNSIWSIKSTKDCRFILSSSGSYTNDKLLILWDGNKGREIKTLINREIDNKKGVISISLSNNSKFAAALLSDNSVIIWDIPECNIVKEIKNIINTNKISFSNDDLSIILYTESEVKNYNIETGEIKIINNDSKKSINKFIYNKNTAELINNNTKKTIKVFSGFVYGPQSGIFAVSISPDKKYILSSSDSYKIGDRDGRTLKLWDLSLGKLLKLSEEQYVDVTSISFTADGNFFASGSKSKNGIKIWEIKNRTCLYELGNYNTDVNSITFSPDNQNVLVASEDKLDIWNYRTSKTINSLHNFKCGGYREVAFSPYGNKVFEICFDNKIHQINIWDIDKNSLEKTIQPPRYPISLAISSDGSKLLCGSGCFDRFSDNVLSLIDIESGKIQKKMIGHSNYVRSIKFLPDNKYAISGSMDNNLMLWDIDNEKSINVFSGHTMGINSINIANDGSIVVSGSRDNTIKLWDIKTGKEIITMISVNENDYLMKTPDDYYLSSKNGYKGIVYRIEDKIYPPEQFDLQYNRPDIILERIGLAPKELIDAYRKAYEKRLKRMNFNEEMFNKDFHIPEMKIMTENIPITTPEKYLSFKIKAEDSKYNLDRINLYVNDVPIYGTNGIDLRAKNTNQNEQDIKLELSSGKNKVQVSVLNEKGVESLKEIFDITYEAPVTKHDLYVVTIGASDYNDSRNKLNYAAKDANDIADLMIKQKAKYNDVKVLKLLDKDVTKENILKAKEFLMQSKVDDEVIVFIAGHGLLTKDFDYYFATSDIDFNNPKERGVTFEDIESLLDG